MGMEIGRDKVRLRCGTGCTRCPLLATVVVVACTSTNFPCLHPIAFIGIPFINQSIVHSVGLTLLFLTDTPEHNKLHRHEGTNLSI